MAAAPLLAEAELPVALPLQQTIAPRLDTSEDESRDDEEEVALLPRHTKVRVVGNSRCKSSLVGQTGVVKKAVGLGGWHWLRLASGEEVRLQRNALSVVELPTGLESDFSDMEENDTANQLQEALPRVRSRRPPRQLEHSPDIPQSRRLSVRNTTTHPRPNFLKLDSSALKKYKRYYKLQSGLGPNPSKEQLAHAVRLHFASQVVDEAQVIAVFIEAALRRAQCAPV